MERGGGQVGEDVEGKGSRPAPSRCTQPTHNKHEQAAVWESSRALDWRRNRNVSHTGELWRARNSQGAFSVTRFGVGFNMAVWPLKKESSQGPAATAATYAPPRHTPRAILIINGTRNFRITCNHLPDQWKSTFHRNSIEKTLPLRLGHSHYAFSLLASLVGRCYGRRRMCPTVSLTHSHSCERERSVRIHDERGRGPTN